MKNCFHSLHLLTMFIVRVQFHDVYAVIVKEYNKKNTVRLLKRTSKTIKSVFRGYLLQNLAGFGYLFSMFQGGIFLFPIFFFWKATRKNNSKPIFSGFSWMHICFFFLWWGWSTIVFFSHQPGFDHVWKVYSCHSISLLFNSNIFIIKLRGWDRSSIFDGEAWDFTT